MQPIPLTRKIKDLTRGREVLEMRPSHRRRWVTLAIVFLATVLVTSPSLWIRTTTYHAGDTLAAPVIAEIGFDYEPPDAEAGWLERRERLHNRIYVYDGTVEAKAVERLRVILDAASRIDPRAAGTPDAWRAELEAVDPQLRNWTTGEIIGLVNIAQDERFRDAARILIKTLYLNNVISEDEVRYRADYADQVVQVVDRRGLGGSSRIIPSDQVLRYPDEVRERISLRLDSLFRDLARGDPEALILRSGLIESARRLLNMVVKPNLEFDAAATEAAKERFPQPSFVQRVAPGTVLAGPDAAGDPGVVSEEEASLLQSYSQVVQRTSWLKFAAQVVFVLIAFLIISFFVRKFIRDLEFTSQNVLLLAMPVLLALALGRVFLLLGPATYAGFAFPAGLIGILGVLLLPDSRIALLLVTWGCLLFGLEANLNYEFVIVGLFGGYTAVAALSTFRERREVLYAGVLIGVVKSSTIFIINFIAGTTDDLAMAVIVGGLSGVLSSLLSFAIVPVFEVLFKIPTDLRLLELSGLQHPLLRRMEEEAPGTWQHTLNVMKLAEAAASAIGVSYLLVRAACLFHDIGKLSKPTYFTENQITPEDKRRHAALSPHLSTLVILNHVKEGVEMARRANLPQVIIDMIQQHHGTSLVRYFFQKAQSDFETGVSKQPVREDDYRYPGPKPQTREAAVLLLADTVEATATAKLSGRTVREDDIQMVVRNSISEKFGDGQFDECNLTMRDLNVIREVFIKTLRSRFHTRIDYPSRTAPQSPAASGPSASKSREVKKLPPPAVDVSNPAAAQLISQSTSGADVPKAPSRDKEVATSA